MAVADGDGSGAHESSDAIGDEAILCPIATADDVAGAGAGDFNGAVFEKGSAIGVDDEFSSGFAGAVGVVAAEGIVFAVGVEPFAVFVAFIGGDEDGGAGFIEFAEGLEDVGSADGVGVPGFKGDFVGEADEGLGGEVEDEVGVGIEKVFFNGGVIANVTDDVVALLMEGELFKETWVCIGREAEAGDFSSKF